jgi:putative oxidoreductase
MTSAYQTPTPVYSTPMADSEIRRMAGVNDTLLLVARIVLVVIYLMSGASKVMDLSGTAAMIASKGLPAPMVLAAIAAAAEILGGLAIVVGFQTRFAAIGLLIYTLVAAYFFHDFWTMPESAERMNTMIHAMKNLSMAGAFLMLAAVGAGRFSIDGPSIMHDRRPAPLT